MGSAATKSRCSRSAFSSPPSAFVSPPSAPKTRAEASSAASPNPVPVKPRTVMAQPSGSCMAQPKYSKLSAAQAAPSSASSNAERQPQENTANSGVHRAGQAVHSDKFFPTPADHPTSDGGSTLMNCTFNTKSMCAAKGTTADGAEAASLYSLALPHNLDDHSASGFLEYLRQHADRVHPREARWFNVTYSRELLKRSTRKSCIHWIPLEEIAVNETQAVPPPIPPPPPVVKAVAAPVPGNSLVKEKHSNPAFYLPADKKKIATIQPLASQGAEEQPGQNEERPQVSVTRPRSREIIALNLPHREQLARRAIEDNAIFLYTRIAKCR